jgi:hypothetical protein
MKKHRFVCARCGKDCVSHKNDATAIAEFERRFKQKFTREDTVEICGDCEKEYTQWMKSQN